jgi:hypothetical protein
VDEYIVRIKKVGAYGAVLCEIINFSRWFPYFKKDENDSSARHHTVKIPALDDLPDLSGECSRILVPVNSI